tara:strand:- start:17617 stop:18807 length:1191 start_codon:yes stop_codon:yes gene_type:complete
VALNDVRFAKDLKIIEKNSKYFFFRIPYKFQSRLINPIIIKNKIDFNNEYDLFSLKNNNKNKKLKNEIIEKYLNCFSFLFNIINAKAVFSAAVHYKWDVIIGEISKKIGIKYIILHKENFTPLNHQIENKSKFYNGFFKSKADLIITQNELTKKIFEKKLIEKKKIYSLGALRFSKYLNFIKKNNKAKKKNNSRKIVTLFSFSHRSGIYGKRFQIDFFYKKIGWIRLFRDVHKAIYELASNNPNIKFIIKTKWIFEWHDQILKEIGIDSVKNLPKNLSIVDEMSVLKLLKISDLVIAFNSTTILEAGLFGKKVICPNFAEAKNEYKKFVMHNIFKSKIDLANSPVDLKKKILKNLSGNKQKTRSFIKEFEKYISPINVSVIKNYLNKIDNVINAKS